MLMVYTGQANHEVRVLLHHHGRGLHQLYQEMPNLCTSFISSCYDFFIDFLYVGHGSCNKHRFIFVVINYSTKCHKVGSQQILEEKEIICQYESCFIFGNALNLNNNTISEVCSLFKINITLP
ncbi:RNA-directed DNA polymerase [Gossypium australe]|uniref:RNA-directed DNA polymerase n=1 Tax=Gossypium australe TaxID=47621 RepID=A0A5B6VQB3_9ROSI|nr:RNA-directed DNA polymerase [Gossypium australe]